MRVIPSIILIVATTQFSGCTHNSADITSEEQAVARLTSPFASGAITLNLQTDPDLNATRGLANSCTLLIIQAQKYSTLDKLISSTVTLKTLFNASGAQDEILKVDRYPAMPGQLTTLHIDRAENTRYVAIVAGYYPYPQKQHMLLVAVPVVSHSTGWWHKTWQAQLAPLSLTLRLGSSSISLSEMAMPENFYPSASTSLSPVRVPDGVDN